MNAEELARLNESILIMTYTMCLRDIDDACMTFCISRDVATAIAAVPLDKLRAAARGARILLHPGMLPSETWTKLKDITDDAASALTITANNTFSK